MGHDILPSQHVRLSAPEYEISSMETKGVFTERDANFVTERVGHPEHGRFPSYEKAKLIADRIGDNYFPWPV
jgi:hypothetical protein